MLTWALANHLRDGPVTANAVNPGYVLTPLTRNATGPLKLLIALTRFAAQTPLAAADTAIWAAASPELDGLTGKFWSNRHEIRCSFRDPAELQRLLEMVEQQLTATVAGAGMHDGTTASDSPTQTVR
jgi:hypothetical protein